MTIDSSLESNLNLEISTYEEDGKMKASVMPTLKHDSKLINYSRRFEYLLVNVPKIHAPENAAKRKQIWDLYPDTIQLKELYLQEFLVDQQLVNFFELSSNAVLNPEGIKKHHFTADELMEVASKFFYCSAVLPDTSIQTHICIGRNGVKEARWTKDFRLLEAFCYEAIFSNLDNDDSSIEISFNSLKREACKKHQSRSYTFDQYLLVVREELYASMKNDPILKSALLHYYKANKQNLAFEILN